MTTAPKKPCTFLMRQESSIKMTAAVAVSPDNILTEDRFLDGRVTLLQPAKGPRAAIDAVFLAAACPDGGGRELRVLEAGAGGGAVSLMVASRLPAAQVTGVEIDAGLVALAQKNILRNGFGERVQIVAGDITAPFGALAAAGIRPESFGHVLANPPFYESGRVREPPGAQKRRAHVAAKGDLARWAGFLAACAAAKGGMTVIHHANALPELLTLFQGRFGALTVFPLFPREGVPAIRVLVQGVKGSRAPVRLLRGMVLHDAAGAFTPAALAILRDGERLTMA
jgi:tRNA1(Val) A37 N6-methylase TrmN6